MPYSFTVTQAVGDVNTFPVAFPYILRSHVHGYVNGVEQPLTFLADGVVQFPQDPSALAGTTVVVRRITPSFDVLVAFGRGSLDSAALNALGKQAVYIAQETRDLTVALDNDLRYDARSFGFKNVADPIADQDASNKRWTAALVNAVTAGLAAQTNFVFVQRDPSADDPGATPRYYIHKQTDPSTSWDIKHNLGTYPQVTVFDANGDAVIVPPAFISTNELRLNFAVATAGVAYVS